MFPAVKKETPKRLKGHAHTSSPDQQAKNAGTLEKIRLLQRMIENPAYELTAEDKRKFVKQIISLMA